MSYFRPEIEAMNAYEPGEQRQAKIIKLNTNENPYPCSPRVQQAIARASERGLERYPDTTATAFRVRAGEVLGVDPDWILCGNGSDDILTIVTRALVGRGKTVRAPTPSYILYKTLAEIQGAHFEEIAFAEDWSLGDNFAAAGDDLRLVYLANPNSPSGTVISPERILQLAERLPCPLLVDEAYVDFAEHNCLALVAQNEKILVSRSLSKSYALAGLRFGFLVAQPQMIEQFLKVKDSYNCGALAIAAATAAVDDQAWLRENRAKILATRTRLIEELRRLGFDPPDSSGNFVWTPGTSVPVHPIYEQLKAAGIFVRYMEYPSWGEGLRISVGTDEQIDACLSQLSNMV